MGENHRFKQLQVYAVKEFKFSQGKTLPEAEFVVTPDQFQILKGGVCAALTGAWLREKLSRPFFNPMFEGAFKGPEIHTYLGQNYRTMGSIHKIALIYKSQQNNALKGQAPTQADLWLFNEFRLVLGKDENGASSTTYQSGYLRTLPTSLSFGKVMSAYIKHVLKIPGWGAYVGIEARTQDQKTPGHALGLYRSRDNHVHFFDANCGVYQIKDGDQNIEKFFDTFAKCYSDMGYPIEPGSWAMSLIKGVK